MADDVIDMKITYSRRAVWGNQGEITMYDSSDSIRTVFAILFFDAECVHQILTYAITAVPKHSAWCPSRKFVLQEPARVENSRPTANCELRTPAYQGGVFNAPPLSNICDSSNTNGVIEIEVLNLSI